MDRIKILPDVVANQIAAGEVVGNPSSVVKEMMENSVDAGATSVTVNFREGGMHLVQIVDDGCGMSPLDARMAFDRHATSKIRTADELYSLSTFGFRGEALASIAAVAEVEVRTRQRGEEVGTSVEVSGGTFRAQTPVTCPEGTQFLVRNLFYNVPARKRFLEDTAREARRVKEEFRRVALCHPGVAFKLLEGDAPVYNLPATNLRGRIVGAIGKNIAQNLLEIKADTSLARIEGFVGRPAGARKNNAEQYFFVNGRYFKSGYFHKAVMEAYEKLIPPGSKPSYFIYLQIDPSRIDVNVHPQKTEVKFEDGPALRQILAAAVREGLAKLGALPMMDFDIDTSVEIPVIRPGTTWRSPEIRPNPDFNPFDERPASTRWNESPMVSDRREAAAQNLYTAAAGYAGREAAAYTDYPSAMDPEAASATAADTSLIEFIEGEDAWQSSIEIDAGPGFSRPLAVGERYCAATLGGELLLVDTRRAREAVLYDRYARILSQGAVPSQGLLFPEPVALSMEDCALVRASREELSALGFEFSVPDEHSILLSAIPADFTDTDPAELLAGLLPSLELGEGEAGRLHAGRLAAALARAGAAVRPASDEASLAALLDALAACAEANYTPSGAPVVLRISPGEIKRRLS